MIAVAATAVCLGVAALVAFLALECLLGTVRRDGTGVPADPPAYTVLMPAHDEAQGVARAVEAVMAQLRACDSLLVVADNCSDDTAAVARSLGATVIERFDPNLRGKGHALEFGRAYLQGQPDNAATGEVVIIVDADCIAMPGALARLAATQDRVVQGAYLLEPRADASAKVRISSFAFMIKNQVRQRALYRLAGVALLQGSGMAFPRAVFDRVQWKTDSLVEDLDMGLDLVLAGQRVTFDGSALFLSHASSESGTAGQRRRWEHGMLHSMATYVPALFRQALSGCGRLAFVGLDLMIPPTVMLIATALLALMAGAAILGLTFAVWALLLSLLWLAAGLMWAWHVHGRQILPLRSLLEIPAYMVWKLPIITRFFTHREKQWIRTERES